MTTGFSRLTEALIGLGEVSLEIDQIIIAKIGCVALFPTKQLESESNFPITAQETAQRGQPSTATGSVFGPDLPNMHAAIIKALEKHPNVFDLKVEHDELGMRIRPRMGGWLVSGDSFSLRVELPSRLQKLAWYIEGRSNPIERFEVISDGSLFVAFASIEDYPIFTIIGQEYRELLQEQIEKETQFGWAVFGPVPVHPDFYLVVKKRQPGQRES